MKSDKTFKERLELLIGDMSNRSFADKCGVNEKTIRTARSGKIPGRVSLEKISKENNKSVGWLLGESPKTGEIAATLGDRKHRQKKPEETEKEAPTTEINIQEGVSMTEMVLLSNTSYADALWANIKSFAKAVETEKDMNELKENMREMERKISEKMERMEKLLLSLGATDQEKRDSAAQS